MLSLDWGLWGNKLQQNWDVALGFTHTQDDALNVS